MIAEDPIRVCQQDAQTLGTDFECDYRERAGWFLATGNHSAASEASTEAA
jgi:hypothetical protein